MKGLAGLAVGLIAIGSISAFLALRSDGGVVLACDSDEGFKNQAQAILTDWMAAGKALSSYRVVTDLTHSIDGRALFTGHSELYIDRKTERSIGSFSSFGRAAQEVYEETTTGNSYYRYPGGTWLTGEEANVTRPGYPSWNCERTHFVVVSDGRLDGVIHLRYVLTSRDQKQVSDLREEVFLDAQTRLATRTVSVWAQSTETHDGDRLWWRAKRTCEFSAFNEPVVFPGDLPKTSVGF